MFPSDVEKAVGFCFRSFRRLLVCGVCAVRRIFGSIVYNRAIVYKRQIFLKIVVHVIIIEECNQTAR